MSKRSRSQRVTPTSRAATSTRQASARKGAGWIGAARMGATAAGSGARRKWLTWAAGGMLVAVVVVIVAVAAGGGTGSNPDTGGPSIAAGTGAQALAPDGQFATITGAPRTVFSLHGQPTLLWFVTTWCSSCQAGTQAVSTQIPTLATRHVRVVELELAGDLGQTGPSIAAFARQLAGNRYHNPDWTFGTASAALTQTYDPNGYLDIYYLLNSHGQITYVNSSPAATMNQLLAAVDKITPHA